TSPNFPTTPGAFDTTCGSDGTCEGAAAGSDAFVTKYSATGAIVFSTFLGGSGSDSGSAIALSQSGSGAVNAIIVRSKTQSTDFPSYFYGAAPQGPSITSDERTIQQDFTFPAASRVPHTPPSATAFTFYSNTPATPGTFTQSLSGLTGVNAT